MLMGLTPLSRRSTASTSVGFSGRSGLNNLQTYYLKPKSQEGTHPGHSQQVQGQRTNDAKPVDWKALETTVRAVVQKRQLEKELRNVNAPPGLGMLEVISSLRVRKLFEHNRDFELIDPTVS